MGKRLIEDSLLTIGNMPNPRHTQLPMERLPVFKAFVFHPA
jgi:hypothetical protein